MMPLFEQALASQPEKTDFRAVFFSPKTIWLAPNDLALFQLQNALGGSGVKDFTHNFVPQIITFSALEAKLANEISPPELAPLERQFILDGLAKGLAEALGLDEKNLSPAILGELADSLGDGLDRLKLAGIPWDKVARLKPARLAQVLSALGRQHDEILRNLGRADRFTKRQAVLKLLADGFRFRALDGLEKIECHWSQRLSPFETDLLIALSNHYEVDVIFNIPAWARNEDLAHGSGFDIVRTFREMEKHIGSNKLFLSYSDAQEKNAALSYAAETLLAPPDYRQSDPPDPTGSISITRAPTAYQEVEDAARRIKELIAHGQSQPHDLALVAPDLNSYGPLIEDVGRRLGLPFHFRRGESLAEQSAARSLLELTALWSSNWERSRVLRLLNSPYFTLTERGAAELHRTALRGGVTDRRAGGGFEMNLAKLTRSENEEGTIAAEILKTVEDLKAHGKALAAHKNWPDFFAAFHGILTELGWPGPLDDAAVPLVREEMENLALAFSCPYAPDVSIRNFRLWLKRALPERNFGHDKSPEGRVWALNYYDIHGGVFDEIFFLGLNERLFPQTGASNRWWPEEFIKATNDAAFLGRPLWSSNDDRYRQEELMLATGLGQARRRAHLYYHQTGDDGRAALPSPLLSGLKELWPELKERETVTTLPPPPELVRGEDELWADLIAVPPDQWPRELCEREDWQKEWHGVHRRRAAWRQMQKEAKPGAAAVGQWLEQGENYNGRPLIKPEFLKSVADCPLAFWWWQSLGLEGDDAPVEEWPKSREGTLLHKVLEKFFQPRLGKAWPGAEDFEKCRAELLGILEREIKSGQSRMPLGRLPLWQTRVKKLPEILTQWLQREFDRPATVKPFKLEWTFGEDNSAPPYELPLSDSESIYFKGRIDRIDEAEEGLAVRDYKSRESSVYKVKTDKGGVVENIPPAALPLAIYTRAASEHLARPAHSFYEFIKATPGSAGQLPLPHDETFDLPEHLRGLWGQVIAGVYEPSGDGCDWCTYQSLCPRLDKSEEGG